MVCGYLNLNSVEQRAMDSFHMKKRHFSSSIHTECSDEIVVLKRNKNISIRMGSHAQAHNERAQTRTPNMPSNMLFCVGRFASYRRRIAQRISCDRFVSIFGPLFDTQSTFIHPTPIIVTGSRSPHTHTHLPQSFVRVRFFSHSRRFDTKNHHIAMLAANPIVGDVNVDVALLSTVMLYMHGFRSIILLLFSFSLSMSHNFIFILFHFVSIFFSLTSHVSSSCVHSFNTWNRMHR